MYGAQQSWKQAPGHRRNLSELRSGLMQDMTAGRIFRRAKSTGIIPIIKIRRNAEYKAKGVSRERGIAALDQLGGGITNLAKFHDMDIKERTENQNEWKKHIEYGSRWQVEIFFSAFKRIFGSSVMAKTMDNIIQEIALKIQRYNQFVDITQRVISMA